MNTSSDRSHEQMKTYRLYSIVYKIDRTFTGSYEEAKKLQSQMQRVLNTIVHMDEFDDVWSINNLQ
jgi:hypothetical protein